VLRIRIFNIRILIRIRPFFSIYGSGSGLFIDSKIIFFKINSFLIHTGISFDHEGIPLKEMKNLENTSNKFEKSS